MDKGDKNKTTATALPLRLTKGTIAILIAVLLIALPVGQAIALQVIRGGNADSSAYQAGVGTGSSGTQAIIEAAYAQGVSGASALDSYLNGVPISEGSALSIDASALAEIDYDISLEISSLQSSLESGTYEGSTEDETYADDDDYDYDDTDYGTYDDDDDYGATDFDETDDVVIEDNNEVSEEVTTPNTDVVNPDPVIEDNSSSNNNINNTNNSANNSDNSNYSDISSSNSNSNSNDMSNNGGNTGNEQSTGSSSSAQRSSSGNTTYTPRNIGVSLTTTKFIAIIGEPARKIAQENNLYASVMIAQAILESGSGNSSLSSTYNNIFGIKGRYEGEGVVMRTSEDDGTGNNYSIYSEFRAYPTLADSLEDYANLLTVSMASYYSPAWKTNAATYVDACDYLEGHYATDTSYSEKLQDLITTYELTRYDLPLDYAMVDTYVMPVTDQATGNAVIDETTGNVLTEERDLVDLVIELTSHLGEDYVWGGTTPGSFDCSGLVQYCYRKVFGIELPRTTYLQCEVGTDVAFEDLHMGDLLFFQSSDGSVGHVGVYLAEDCFIEAPKTGDVIKVTSMTEKMPTFAKRIIQTTPVDITAAIQQLQQQQQQLSSQQQKLIVLASGDIVIAGNEAIEGIRAVAVETRARTAVENLANGLADMLTVSIVSNRR